MDSQKDVVTGTQLPVNACVQPRSAALCVSGQMQLASCVVTVYEIPPARFNIHPNRHQAHTHIAHIIMTLFLVCVALITESLYLCPHSAVSVSVAGKPRDASCRRNRIASARITQHTQKADTITTQMQRNGELKK